MLPMQTTLALLVLLGTGPQLPPPVDGFVRAGGARLHVIEWPGPAGDAVLLLPGIGGGGGSAWQWSGIARSLQAEHRVLAVEPRGFGGSDRAADYSWEGAIADIHAVVEHFGLAPVAVVGHSFGARLAMLYAAAHPEAVSRVVLVDVDAVAAMEPQPPSTLTATFASEAEAFAMAKTRWGTADAVDDLVRKWLAHGLKREDNGRWAWRLDPRLRGQLARTLPDPAELGRRARTVGVPTLVIRGAKSSFTRERADAVAAAFPRARVAEVPDSGHVVHLANPAGFLAALSPFLDETAPPSPHRPPTRQDPRASADRDQLERMTREWVAASQEGRAADLQRLLDDTFTFISPRGRLLPKSAYVANRTPGTATMDGLRSDVQDIVVQVYGEAAVVTSRVVTSGRASDGDFSGEYRRRDVWIRNDGVWRAVSNQLAPINYTGAHPARAAAIRTHAPADLEWTASAHVAGLLVAPLHGSEYLGPYAIRVKRPHGHFEPPHRHESDELITVLSGALRLGKGEAADESSLATLPIGAYAVIPGGTPHYSWAEGETVYQSSWSGPAGPTYVATPSPAPAAPAAAPQRDPAEQEIRSLEYERRDALLGNDTAALDRMLAPTLTTVTAGGTLVTRAGELDVNRSTNRKVLAWEFEELDIRVYGDAAVSTIRAKFTDVLAGRQRTEHQRLSHVWAKAGGRWQIVARQATRVGAP